MITLEVDRRIKLKSHGVPTKFLDAIDSASSHKIFESVLKYPESGYSYLNTIKTYKIFQGYDVTPIYDGINEDTFWMLLSNSTEAKFVHFELEQDEIYNDYGDNFMWMLADLIVHLYESKDELSIVELIELSEELGFPNSELFLRALEKADEDGLRKTFKLDGSWRKEHIPKYINRD